MHGGYNSYKSEPALALLLSVLFYRTLLDCRLSGVWNQGDE